MTAHIFLDFNSTFLASKITSDHSFLFLFFSFLLIVD